jgi:oligopeptide transport system substrate-binding protein
MTRTRTALRAAAATATALLAAGCGLVPHSKVYEPPPVVGAVGYGGTLDVGIGQPQGIDPADAYEPFGRMISSLICEPLVSTDPRTGEVKSALVQSWHTSDDGASVYLTLRHDLHFANGDKLNASSIYDALNLLASPTYQSYAAPLLANVSGYLNYHGSGRAAEAGSSRLNGVRIIDSWSVQIQLTDRDSSFLSILADPATAPIDGDVQHRDPAAFAADPTCLGPYRLAEPWHTEDTTITLVRNPAYTPDNAAYTNKGKGYPETVVFHIYPNAGAELAAYESGDIDVATAPGADVAALQKRFGDQLVTGPGSAIDLIAFPTAQPTFNAAPVRVALSQAIDRAAIATDAYRGGRLPLTGFVPPAVGKDGYEDSTCANTPANGDATAARATLTKAGVDLTGKTINLYYDDEYDHGRVAKQVAAQWRQAFGVHVATHGMAWDDYINHAATGTSFDGPFLESWDQAPHRQSDYLLPLLTRQGLGTANLARFDSADVVNLVQTLTDDVTNSSGQTLELHKLGDLACDQMPVTPVTLHRATLLVRQSAVGSARGEFLAIDGSPMLRELFVRQGT